MRDSAGIVPIAVPALGLSFLWPYFRASFLSFLAAFDVHPATTVQSAYLAYTITFMGTALLASTCAPRVELWLRAPHARLVLGILGTAGNAVLWFCGNSGFALAGCIVGTVAATCFFVGSLLAYGMRMATWNARQSALIGFASFGISFLDNAALALGMPVAALFCICTPSVCALCIPAATPITATAASHTPKSSSNAALVTLMVLLALFCVTGNVLRGLTNPWFTHGGVTMRTLYMSLANLVFALISIALLWRRIGVRKVVFWNLTVCMALFFAGLLGLTFLHGTTARVGSDIATVSRVCFTLLLFLFALESHQWASHGLVRLMGLFLLIPEALSAFVRHIVVPPFLVATGVEPVTAASYAGVVIILVLTVTIIVILGNLLLRQMSGQQRDGAVVDGSTPQESLGSAGAPTRNTDALAKLAQTYGLTAREAQTASYVSKGYSLDKTAELLGISINTVRTHMRSVYGKLEIHSRQELIDLLDGMGHA